MPRPLPGDTCVTHFADLRPSHTLGVVSEWLDDDAKLYEAAAVVVTEFVPIASGYDESTQYYYKYLDADAAEIADWGPFEDAEGALSMLKQDAPDVEWEEIRLPDGEALRLVQGRLQDPPRQ